MLLLRVPTADRRSRRASSQQTPSCSVKRSSHRLAFPPELAGKRPRCCRRLLILPAGAPGSIPAVCRCRPVPRGSTAPGAGRARCLPLLRGERGGATAALGTRIYIPRQKAQFAGGGEGPGRSWKPELVIFSRMRMSPSRGSWLRCCPAFVSLAYQLGLGRGTQSFPVARCHMENLQCFDYALCKHFNIGSLKSRDYPKGD